MLPVETTPGILFLSVFSSRQVEGHGRAGEGRALFRFYTNCSSIIVPAAGADDSAHVLLT